MAMRVLAEQTVLEMTRSRTPKALPRHGFGWIYVHQAHVFIARKTFLLKPTAIADGRGNSLWIDPVQDLFLVILTNRTHPHTDSSKFDLAYKARARIGTMLVNALRPR